MKTKGLSILKKIHPNANVFKKNMYL